MSFKNHGPGGCCCGTCPLWQDQFDLNGWNVDDDGKLSWDVQGTSGINFYEQNSALIVSNPGGEIGGPRLRYNQIDSGVDWDIRYGYKTEITFNVDYGFAVIGDFNAGLMFDADTSKAYPIDGNIIYGSGFDFDPSYPFDITMTKTAGPTEKFSALGRMSFCQVNATDRTGNEIDYRFMTEDRGILTLASYARIESSPLLSGPTASFEDYYKAVEPSTPSYTFPPCQFRVHDITMEGISNLKRIPPYWDGKQPQIIDLTFSEVRDCEHVPEWNIDEWINPWQLGNSQGVPAFSPSARVKVTSSNGTSPINRVDNYLLRYVNNYGGGYYDEIQPNTSVNIPSNMVIWSGKHTYRYVYFLPPNIIHIVERFDMSTIGTGDDCFIRYWFDIGEEGNREFPFILDGATAFAADAWVLVEALQTPRINAVDVWNAYGSLEYKIEKL